VAFAIYFVAEGVFFQAHHDDDSLIPKKASVESVPGFDGRHSKSDKISLLFAGVS
jgi:hypothetical protein